MKASISQILRRTQPGGSAAVKGHIARATQVSAAIGARRGLVKHIPTTGGSSMCAGICRSCAEI